MEWISVNDRLPERYMEVLVWPYPTEYVLTAYFGLKPVKNGELGWYYSEYASSWGVEHFDCTPTHWMPLPAAPGEKK